LTFKIETLKVRVNNWIFRGDEVAAGIETEILFALWNESSVGKKIAVKSPAAAPKITQILLVPLSIFEYQLRY
jgi:hypothetical protein